jgi:hypothetical protein
MPKLNIKDVRKNIRATLERPVGMGQTVGLRQQIDTIKKIKIPRV